ncbi:MAG: iron-only hydrogenase system regulator [Eggerthellaceae bacterium]|nr:iron-only hydrogenase system regulator [Eggerthellaceae bacterium]
MESRVAVMAIIVEDLESAESVNALLHENAPYIVGRMGIPYRQRGISVMSVVLDAPQDAISAMAGRIGALPGVSVKTAFSNIIG